MILTLGIVTRIGLLLYGGLQDSLSAVKYTDVDYEVYSDAAAFVAQGRSPYDRSTYRYTPILAWLLLPNAVCHPLWGKVLFSAADLLAACAGKHTAAAAVLGVAIHWRIFPVIYILPVLLWLTRSQNKNFGKETLLKQLQSLLSYENVLCGAVATGTFLALGSACYAAYGQHFLHETYLYHSGRKDPRHNFSIYFYSAYLEYGSKPGASISWAAPVTQLISTSALGVAYAEQLPLCMMLQTMAFVAFNKVCTAQYFVWWFTLLPLVLPNLDLSWGQGALRAIVLWAIAQVHWLAWAYLLEYEGRAVYLQLWIASVVMCFATVYLMVKLMQCCRCHRFAAGPKLTPSFNSADLGSHDKR